MTGKKKSTFITQDSVPDNHFVDTFGAGVNRKVPWLKFLDQVKEVLVGPSVLQVQSITDLATIKRTPNQQYSRAEFWPGTGVGGVKLVWEAARDVSEHNGGTIIDPAKISELNTTNKTFGTYFTADTVSGNTGCFVVVDKSRPNAAIFGALGDGVTDCTGPSQAIADSVGWLEFGEGTFLIDSVSVTQDLTLLGVYGETILLHKGPASGFMFNVQGSSVKFFGSRFYFNGNRSAQNAENSVAAFMLAQSDGVSEVGRSEVRISESTFFNTSYGGIYAYGTINDSLLERLVVTDCYFVDGAESSSTFSPRFIGVLDGVDAEIRNNYFDWGRTPVSASHPAIWVAGTSVATEINNKLLIDGNTVKRCGRNVVGSGIGAVDAYIWGDNVVVSNNRFTDCYSVPIRAKTNSEKLVISGNIIDGAISQNGDRVDGISVVPGTAGNVKRSLVVSGNVIKNIYEGNAITVDAAPAPDRFWNLIVSDNICENADRSCVYLDNCENWVVCNNVMDICLEEGININECGPGVISGNHIQSPSLRGVLIANTTAEILINGNTIKNTGSNGVQHIGVGGKLTLEGNIMISVATSGFAIEEIAQFSASGNGFTDVPTPFRVGGTAGTAYGRISGNYATGNTGTVMITGAGVTKLFESENSWNP